MTFSCKNYDVNKDCCSKLKCECVPGRRGCVLEGRVQMSDGLRKKVKELETSFYAFRNNGIEIPGQWIPSTFAVIEEEFSEANQLINSTMKLVRHKVRDFYKDRIELMYSDESAHRQANLDVLGKIL